jgi:glycogen synthase
MEPAFKELASRITDAIFVKIDVNELTVRHASCGPDAILLSSFFMLLGGEWAAIARLGLVLWYSEYTMI